MLCVCRTLIVGDYVVGVADGVGWSETSINGC